MKKTGQKLLAYICALLLVGCTGDLGQLPSTLSLKFQGTTPGQLQSSSTDPESQQPDTLVLDLTDSFGEVKGQIELTEAKLAIREIYFGIDDDSDDEEEHNHHDEDERDDFDDDEEDEDYEDDYGDDEENDDDDDFEDEVDDDSSEDENRFAGPFVVDLIRNTTSPSLDQSILPTKEFDMIEIVIDKPDDDEVTDHQIEHTLVLKGLYTGPTANGVQTRIPFTLNFDLEHEIVLENLELLDILSLVESELIVAFRMEQWFDYSNGETNFDEFDPTQLIVENGEIRLDEDGVNDQALMVVLENIESSVNIGEDDDDDGWLDCDEDEDSENDHDYDDDEDDDDEDEEDDE